MNKIATSIDSLRFDQLKSCRVVFTNGCFDILHIGHIKYLREAKKKGDKLVIGVNSDASVHRLKGPERPVNDLAARMEMLAALEMVDLVIPFEEDTPIELIKIINPDVLVKGGDYEVDTIVGADHVRANGGTVEIIPYVEGYSTSLIIGKLKHQ